MVAPTTIEATDTLVWVSARTDIGMRRPSNEDSMLVADLATGTAVMSPDMNVYESDKLGMLMAISDGMGGAVGGEVASHLAVTELHNLLLTQTDDFDVEDQLRMAVELANLRVWTRAQAEPALAGMGTSLTAALVRERRAYIAQVGHSRAYLIRDDLARQITTDQSLAQSLLDHGVITQDKGSAFKNVLIQALGTLPVVRVVLTSVEIRHDDHLLICSDGLSNKVTSDEISLVVQQSANLTDSCMRLIEIANERGGEDNISVILARISIAARCRPFARASPGDLKVVT